MTKKIILIILILVFGLLCFYFGNNFNIIDGKQGYYIEQGYSFKIPLNWQETKELGPLAFLNENEDNGENPFKSYIFFVKDELRGRSPEQYFSYIKDQVRSSSQEMEILEEKDNGPFHIIVIKTVQNDVSYIIGTALTKGVNDTYLIINLNTLESNFENTKPVFEETYKSFKLR